MKSNSSSSSRRHFVRSLGVMGTAGMLPLPASRLAASQAPLFVSAQNFPRSTDTTEDIIYMSAVKLAQMIREKKVSAREAVNAYIDRIESVNDRLNAVVMNCFDRARLEADEADRLLAQGTVKGPLHGVPMTLKDSFDAAGVISTGGTLGRLNYVPEVDATCFARCRAAGAILLGKSNTPEFTLASGVLGVRTTNNIIYGLSKNPYNLDHSTSGSSGGAGAIVAAGGAAFDIGTDWGGSVRGPAHANGIAGIKPTSVLIPRTGHIVDYGGVFDAWQQPGPMTRKVEDLILLTPLMAGPDFKDAACNPVKWRDPAKVEIDKLKVAYFPTNEFANTTTETQQAVLDAAGWLKGAGAQTQHDLPKALLEELGMVRGALVDGDGWAFLKRAADNAGSKALSASITQRLADANPIASSEYTRLLEAQDANRSRFLQWFKQYDILLCPVAGTPAPTINGEVLPPNPRARLASYTGPFNTLGWPSTVVRVGTSPEGLPIGIQVVAKPWRDDVSLAVASYIESKSGGWKKPNI
jgi:amidase